MAARPGRRGAAAVEAQADADEAAGEVLRLRRLTRDAGLTALDVELLLVALLPDLDTRFERLYGYLNDDVTRRRASVALALELAGASPMVGRGPGPAGAEPAAAAARPAGRRGPRAPVADPRPPGARPGVGPPARRRRAGPAAGAVDRDGAAVRHPAGRPADPGPRGRRRAGAHPGAHAGHRGRGRRRRAVRDWPGGAGAGPAPAHHGARPADRWSPWPSARRCCAAPDWSPGRSRRWPSPRPDAVHRLTRAGVPVVLVGTATWDPQWSAEAPLLIDAPALGGRERLELWHSVLQSRDPPIDDSPGRRPHLALGPGQVQQAVRGRRGLGPAERRTGHRRRPAPRRTRPERGRPGTAGPADRAGRRLGRPGAAPGRVPRPAAGGRPGPAPRHRADRLADAPRRRPRARGGRRCSPATPAPARRCRPR